MKSTFKHEGFYICECGQTFTDSQKFNNHKSMCSIHYAAIGKSIEDRNESHRNACKEASLKRKQQNAELKAKQLELELQQWLSEQHICEKCGKVMTEKYGSGRFCSASCAKTRKHSAETKEKIRQKAKNNNFGFKSDKYKANRKALSLEKQVALERAYLENPSHCIICGNILPFENMHRKTCSAECRKICNSSNGGFKQNSAKNYKWGYYHGICCDSSWELAFLIYCIEHDIQIERNFQSFPYIIDGEQHSYTPDFKINQTFIEIKGYVDNISLEKYRQIKDLVNYKFLTFNDLKICINYCKEKYGNRFWEVLYDKELPSCNIKLDNN